MRSTGSHWIEALSKIGDVMRSLKLRDESVLAGIKTGSQSVDSFYHSGLGHRLPHRGSERDLTFTSWRSSWRAPVEDVRDRIGMPER